jgi:hypothetical protein
MSKQNTFNPQFLTLAPVIVRTVGLFGRSEERIFFSIFSYICLEIGAYNPYSMYSFLQCTAETNVVCRMSWSRLPLSWEPSGI